MNKDGKIGIEYFARYDKILKKWTADTHIKIVFSYSYVNKEYRLLTKKELEEIKLLLFANKYNYLKDLGIEYYFKCGQN